MRALCSFEGPIYGQVVSALAQAPRSTDDAGRYGFVTPAPIAGLPGDSAKLVPTGCVVSVPTEDVPTFTHSGDTLDRLGGELNTSPFCMNVKPAQLTPMVSARLLLNVSAAPLGDPR